MYKYYLTIDSDRIGTVNPDHTPGKAPDKAHDKTPEIKTVNNTPKDKKILPKIMTPSPRKLKKNISNENFIKYQWAWVV